MNIKLIVTSAIAIALFFTAIASTSIPTVNVQNRTGGIFDYNRGYIARELNRDRNPGKSPDWLTGWDVRDREIQRLEIR